MKKITFFALFILSLPSLAWCMQTEKNIDEATKKEKARIWFEAVKTFRSFNIEDLLEKGYDPEMQDEQGRTAIMIAAVHNYDVLRLLLEKGAQVNRQDNDGKTALIWATEGSEDRYWTPIKMLLQKGADNTIQDNKKRIASSLVDKLTQRMMNDPEDFDYTEQYKYSSS